MATQYSVAVNNARLDAIESTAGASAKLRIYSGAQPANCAAAASGTLLCEMALPADWMNAAATASKTKLGTWSGAGLAAGVAGHYRIVDTAGTTCHMQGSAAMSAADMILDNSNIAVAQIVTVNSFTINAANT